MSKFILEDLPEQLWRAIFPNSVPESTQSFINDYYLLFLYNNKS